MSQNESKPCKPSILSARKLGCIALSAAFAFSAVPTVALGSVETALEAATATEARPLDDAAFQGADLVRASQAGRALTLSELKQIDMAALRAIDPTTADKLSGRLAALEAEAAADSETPAPGAPDEPTEDEVAASADGSASSPSTAEEDDTPDALNPSDELVEPTGEESEAEAERGEAIGHTSPVAASPAVAVQQDATASTDSPHYPDWSYAGDTTFISSHYTDDWNTERFIAVIGEPARSTAAEHEIAASRLIAEAVLDSNSGLSDAAQKHHNLFNIEALDESGVPTGAFADYGTYLESLEEHAAIMAESADSDVIAPLDETREAEVTNLIETYDLTRFDAPLDYELVHTITTTVYNEETGVIELHELGLPDLIAEATAHLGTPYVWGGTTPEGFDCSGLVQYAYRIALDMKIPRTTYYQCLQGEDVDFADLHAGDLVFFVRDGETEHVGMYLGDGYYLEAPHSGATVQVTAMDEKMPTFAKRLLPTTTIDRIEDEALESN